MAVTKQDGDENNPNPISRRRLPADFGRASKQISSIGDLFTERRKRPYNKQPKQGQFDIFSYRFRPRRRYDRRPNAGCVRFDDVIAQDDSQSGRGPRDQDETDP